jgi:hypothetical protein
MMTKRVAHDFPVVCAGGSAGGLDAYTRLPGHLPADMRVLAGSDQHRAHGEYVKRRKH